MVKSDFNLFTDKVYCFTPTGDVKVLPVTTESYGAKAPRPKNSRLSKRSLDEAGFSRLPNWKDAVKEYLSRRKEQIQ